MNLLEKISKVGSIKNSTVISESKYFKDRGSVQSKIPIINIAFSGTLDRGFSGGVTVIAGESKSFKTLLSLTCLKDYLDSDPEAFGVFYDCEFGASLDYLKSVGIDVNRVLHVPLKNIEDLTFDMVAKLEEIPDNSKVFFLLDSLGNLASKKESEDAKNAKGVSDMTRAKSIKAFFRLITPEVNLKNIPFFVINHTYKTQELYSKNVVSGGTGVMYSSGNVFIITKSQEKEGDKISGWNFTINIEKSRFSREKSKLPFTVLYKQGLVMYSGLLDIALESGHVIKPSVGYYANAKTPDLKFREKKLNTEEFWGSILEDQTFKDYVEKNYKATSEDGLNFDIEEDEELD